ncbi:MAG: transcription antitermination factor NusB [Candidatus Omnitrophica bacterium]|nr:transcription antitermination factor NusB [Candidatus Omnitrophota bacterium]
MRLRSKAREIALFILYQREITKKEPKELLDVHLENEPQQEEVINFASVLLKGIVEKLSVLDSIIKKYAKNWGIDRMAIIDRNILRMAIFEIISLEDIPPKVSINEAIELAKRFGDKNSSRFVNGIVDKVYKMEKQKGMKTLKTNGKS